MSYRTAIRCGTLLAAAALTGCDQLGLETPAKTAERQIAEAKAIGGACRHALRAIEDCYILNTKADKSSVFAGWREMDEYMRENKLEGIAPVVPRPPTGASKARAKPADADDDVEEEVVSESVSRPSSAAASAQADKALPRENASASAQSMTTPEGAAKSRGDPAGGTEKSGRPVRP